MKPGTAPRKGLINPIPDPITGCHNWPGTVNGRGYGLLNRGGRSMSAHRWYWIQANGPILKGLVLDHLCRNPRCCNPEHLEAVDHRTNVLRGISPAIITHNTNMCQRGHKLTPENTMVRKCGTRQCRACHSAASHRRYEAKRKHNPERI